ncbi:MAG: efflux RND transporter periplasmic adaptor subunit [Anaeromyxobacteraceae bacterium]
MRRAAKVALTLGLLAAGFAAGRLLPGSAPRPGAAAAQPARFQCPMHPSIQADHPGTAPCCGMAFEAIRDGAGGSSTARPAGTVAIDAGLRQLQGVKVAAAEKGATVQSLRLFGRVAADETRVYSLNAAMEGSIRDMSGVTTGSVVHRGEKLASFFSAELRSPLQAYLTAIDARDLDPAARAATHVVTSAGTTPQRNVGFSAERLRGMGVSTRQIDEMARRREVPITIDILSPTDGVVLARGVTLGQKFDRGAEWFRIANLDRVWIVVDALEGDVQLARPGMKAAVSVPGRPGTLTAVVSKVPAQFDAESRTHKIRLEVENPGMLLRPDMYVDVALSVERPAALTVPVDAIVDSGLRRTVFVEAGEGVYEPRAVETGWRAGGRVEVLSGLSAGDRIVVSGAFLVDSESQLRATAAAPRGPIAKDPICGMDVDTVKARAEGKVSTHGGETHYFCSDSCKATFAGRQGSPAITAQVAGRP